MLSHLLHSISDHGNAIASKSITYIGVAGGVGGGTAHIVSEVTNKTIECAPPSWLVYVPFMCFISLAVKHAADIYFKHKELKRAENDNT